MDIIVAITLFILALLIGVEVIGKVPATCLLSTSDAADEL